MYGRSAVEFPERIVCLTAETAEIAYRVGAGDRVVGRSTPLSVTRSPTSELTSVDLPAPVEPPTTTTTGASSWTRRGRM